MKRDHNDSLSLSWETNDSSLDQSDISFDVFGYLRNTFEEIDWNDSEIIFRSN